MRRVLPTCLTLWLLLLPALCLAGAIEHACRDSAAEELCGHEENCAEDPCIEDQARTETSGASDRGPSFENRVGNPAIVTSLRNPARPIPDESPALLQNISGFQSDRPLLN